MREARRRAPVRVREVPPVTLDMRTHLELFAAGMAKLRRRMDMSDMDWVRWTPEEWRENLTSRDGEPPTEELRGWKNAGVDLMIQNCGHPWVIDVTTGLPE